jgi:hypothetical protein
MIQRPTATATANYFDLLDALISSAFDHKRSPGSAEAYAILVDMITPPDFEEKNSCAECFESFSVTNFRHHCRNCGRSICRLCSSLKNKRIPKYGYTDPVRVSIVGTVTEYSLQSRIEDCFPPAEVKEGAVMYQMMIILLIYLVSCVTRVQVCYPCAIKVEAEATMDRVQWRLLRIKDHINVS